MKAKAIPIVMILVLSMFALALLVPEQAHAAGPALDVQAAGQSSAGAAVTTNTNLAPAAANELVVVALSTQDTSTGVCGSAIHATSISFQAAMTFTEVGGTYQCVSRSGINVGTVDIWYGFTTGTTSITATANWSGNVNTGWIVVSVYTNTASYTLKDSQTGVCSTVGSCTTSVTTTSSSSYGSGDVLVGDSITRGGTSTSAGAGFTALNWYNGATTQASCSSASPPMCIEYLLPSSSSTTNYPNTLAAGGNPWVVEGAHFGSGTVTQPFNCVLSGGPNFPSAFNFQTVALSGGSVSPASASCPTIVGATTQLTVNSGATITATAPACTQSFCYFFLSGSTYTTTTTHVACGSGTCATWSVTMYALSPAGAPVIGSCPVKNTATTTLANNTVYLYTQTNAGLGNTVIPQLQVFIASVNSGNTPETLSLGIYVTVNPGAVGASNPLVLQPPGARNIVLTPGTTNQLLVVNTNFVYGFLGPGYTFAIALAGNSKISINQSSISGMTKFGNLPGGLPLLTTTVGSSTTGLYFCGSSIQQNIVFTTSFTTSTSTSISTTTSGVTTTTVSSVINAPTPTGNWIVPFLWIMIPIGIALGAALIFEEIRRWS